LFSLVGSCEHFPRTLASLCVLNYNNLLKQTRYKLTDWGGGVESPGTFTALWSSNFYPREQLALPSLNIQIKRHPIFHCHCGWVCPLHTSPFTILLTMATPTRCYFCQLSAGCNESSAVECCSRVADDGVAASSSVRPDHFRLSAGTVSHLIVEQRTVHLRPFYHRPPISGINDPDTRCYSHYSNPPVDIPYIN